MTDADESHRAKPSVPGHSSTAEQLASLPYQVDPYPAGPPTASAELLAEQYLANNRPNRVDPRLRRQGRPVELELLDTIGELKAAGFVERKTGQLRAAALRVPEGAARASTIAALVAEQEASNTGPSTAQLIARQVGQGPATPGPARVLTGD